MKKTLRVVRSFKCGSRQVDSKAFCNTCGWFVRDDNRSSSRVCSAARRHTQATGHETRIDVTSQRGYRVLPS